VSIKYNHAVEPNMLSAIMCHRDRAESILIAEQIFTYVIITYKGLPDKLFATFELKINKEKEKGGEKICPSGHECI